ncbi:MAG: hypothetical protein WAV50_01390 [Minisyncoccia bacterium]
MIEKITVRIFLICLASCASLVLGIIWTGGPDNPASEVYFKTAATLFIVGLSSFLCWFVTMLYSLRDFLRTIAPHLQNRV